MNDKARASTHRALDQVIDRGPEGSTVIGFVARSNHNGDLRMVWGTADEQRIFRDELELVIGLTNSLNGELGKGGQKLYRTDTGEEIGDGGPQA